MNNAGVTMVTSPHVDQSARCVPIKPHPAIPLPRELEVRSMLNSYCFRRLFIISYKSMFLIAFTVLFALSLPAQSRFVRVPSYAAGGSLPAILAQRDVNNDGKLDLIVM